MSRSEHELSPLWPGSCVEGLAIIVERRSSERDSPCVRGAFRKKFECGSGHWEERARLPMESFVGRPVRR